MAQLAERLKDSSIGLVNIQKSLSLTDKSIASTKKSVDNISRVVSNNSKIKNELFQKSAIIETRRKEASKRKEREDQLEASQVSTIKARGLSFGSKTSGGVFSRLLSFMGYITAGWLVENLPTWIFMGKEFITRIDMVGRSIFNMTNDINQVLNDFGNVLSSSLNAIINLDFNEFTEGNVFKSFEDLNVTVDSLGKDIVNAFEVFKTPLTESIETGERAPGLGDMREESLYDEGGTGTGGGANQTRASYGTREQRAMLDTIAWAEGGRTYRTMFGGGQFDVSKGWRHPDTVVRGGRHSSAAAGRYQFMPFTWAEAQKALNLNDFSPINQDKGAIFLMDRRLGANSADILKREGVSDRVLNALAPEWAAIPMARGKSYYRDQNAVTPKQFRDKYNSFLGSVTFQPQQTQQRTPATSTPLSPITGTSGPSMGNRPLSVPYSPFAGRTGNPILSSGIGMRRGRYHTGYDIAADPGTPLYAYFPGTVTHIGLVGTASDVGYGNWVVWKDNVYGAYHFFGHMQRKASVNVGDSVSQGTLMGLVGDTGRSEGPHLHWEISNTPPQSNGQFTSYEDPGQWLRKHPMRSTPTISARSTPMPSIASTASSAPMPMLSDLSMYPVPTPSQFSQITPEREGQNIIIADNRTPQTPQYIPSGSGNYSYASNTLPNEFEILNNFIKNKLLLDLTYL